MSGLYERYREYLKDIPSERVRLVDSRRNSAAQGLLALHAAERLRTGVSLNALAEELEQLRSRTQILVCLKNLQAMVASGRLPQKIGKMLQLLGFLPLVSIDKEGKGSITGIRFSKESSERLLLKKVFAAAPKQYAIVHFDNSEKAEDIAAKILEKTGVKPQYISDISAVVANFAGQGAFAVVWIE